MSTGWLQTNPSLSMNFFLPLSVGFHEQYFDDSSSRSWPQRCHILNTKSWGSLEPEII